MTNIKTKQQLIKKLNKDLVNLWGDGIEENVNYYIQQGLSLNDIYEEMLIQDEIAGDEEDED